MVAKPEYKNTKRYWLCKKYLELVLSNSTCPLYFSYVRMLGFLQLRNMKYTILLLQRIKKIKYYYKIFTNFHNCFKKDKILRVIFYKYFIP